MKKIHAAADFAAPARIFRRDTHAAEAWRGGLYDELTDDRGGLFGAATSRAEAQVMRIAMIYAILDRSTEITLPHLDAAVQVGGTARTLRDGYLETRPEIPSQTLSVRD